MSICTTCYRKIDGKIVFEDGRVWMLKHCLEHGSERVLMSDDIEYYRQCREVYLKPPEMPQRRNTPIKYGCPYDCGLCPDHEQHSCLSLIEVTDACNLRCPICYAGSGPERQTHRSLEHIEKMLDAVVANEGEPDIVQISGGEPTIHPQFFEILDAAKKRPIRHLMVNTNGVRLARDREFVKRLATYKPFFEIYLQFDSLRSKPLEVIRGADLRDIRMKALEHLNEFDVSTTLVVTLQRGVNDDEIGEIIQFALTQKCVRGVTLQPVQVAGRIDGYNDATNRLTLSEVRRRVIEQSKVFAPEDIVPVPCHPDSLAMGYAFKGDDGDVVPLTSLIGRDALMNGAKNTVIFEREPAVQGAFVKLFSTALGSDEQPEKLKDLLCCLPRVKGDVSYANVFRLLIVEFIDAQSFDLRSVKKTCIHIVHPDGRLIPFDTYNMFYRDELETTRLAPLQEHVARA